LVAECNAALSSPCSQCDGSGSGDASWPELEAVRVLGWQGGVSAPTVEVLQGADGRVLSTHKLKSKQVGRSGCGPLSRPAHLERPAQPGFGPPNACHVGMHNCYAQLL
jgi:hypothetical protein